MGKLVLLSILLWAFAIIAPAIAKAEKEENSWVSIPNLPQSNYQYERETNTFKGEIYYYVQAVYSDGKRIRLYVGVYNMNTMMYIWNPNFLKFTWDKDNLVPIKKK